MADKEKEITIEDLPEPISDQDMLLHNIIDGTPDITDLEPNSRQEIYLKYIALNGGSGGGGGGGSSVDVVQTTGSSTEAVMSQKAVTDEINKLGTAAYCNTGNEEGDVPVLNSEGKLDNSVIPALAITDTFVAEDEEQMLNLQGAERGDICIRTDENKTYILDETPKKYSRSKTRTTLSDWVELQTPTDEVQSVNGQKGNVVLSAGDVDSYTKSEVDAKVPTIVQGRGTSTKNVMSQNAVSTLKVFGSNATSTSTTGIVIGSSAKSIGTNHIVIGNSANVTDGNTAETPSSNSIAIGYNARCVAGADNYSAGSDSIAIGSNAITGVNKNCIAIGKNSYSNNISAIAIGEGCRTTVTADYSVSLGTSANTSAKQSVSIGNNATCSKSYSVSLGSHSTITEPSTVSVGDGSTDSNYGTRRIVNVKDPVNDQDAATKKYVDDKVAESGSGVNVVQETGESEEDVMSQKAVTDSLATKVDAVEGKGLSTEDFTTAEKEKLANIPDDIPEVNIVQTRGTSETDVMSQKAVSENTCFGYLASDEGSDNVTIGYSTHSTGSGNVSIGMLAQANIEDHVESNADNSVTIGSGSNVTKTQGLAIGGYASCTAKNSVALGYSSKATEENVVSVSNPNYAQKRRIVQVGDPINDQDAATKIYVDSKVAQAGGGSSVTVVQTTGTSEEDVMSQKAVSENTILGEDSSYTLNNSSLYPIENTSVGVIIGKGASATTTLSSRSNSQDRLAYGIAIGKGANTTGETENPTINVCAGIAIGDNATSTVLVPEDTNYAANAGVALGNNSLCNGDNAVALGNNSKAQNTLSIGIGSSSNASGSDGIAIGTSTKAIGVRSVAICRAAQANNVDSIALGMHAETNADHSISIGCYANSTGESSIALGDESLADEDYVVSVGSGNRYLSGEYEETGIRRIINVGDPVNEQDATTKKYVDSKIVVYNATLTTAGWTTVDTTTELNNGIKYYIQQVNIDGIQESDNPLVDVFLSSPTNTFSKELTSFSYISKMTTNDGSIWATCLYNKPTVDLNIRLVCFR